MGPGFSCYVGLQLVVKVFIFGLWGRKPGPFPSRFSGSWVHRIRGHSLPIFASRTLNYFRVYRGPSTIRVGLSIFFVRPSTSFPFILWDVIGGSSRAVFPRAVLDFGVDS